MITSRLPVKLEMIPIGIREAYSRKAGRAPSICRLISEVTQSAATLLASPEFLTH